MKIGVHTRSAIYASSLLDHEGGVRALLTAKAPRVGTLQGISPGAPVRGLGAFASDGVRVGLQRACPQSTVISGPTTAALAARANASHDLQQMLKDANDTGLLDPECLARLGKAIGVDYFFLGTVSSLNVSNSTRFSPLGLTMVRSDWTTMTLVLQLYHAPTGRIVWQSLGDCTGYTESPAALPISVHVVTSDLCETMVNDLLLGRSRTTQWGTGNEPEHREHEPPSLGRGGNDPTMPDGAEDATPPDSPDVVPDLPADASAAP